MDAESKGLFSYDGMALKYQTLMSWAEEHLEFLVHPYLVSKLTG